MKGPGSGRESAVRAVQTIGIEITSIKRLKGEDRPINNEEMRSLLLASLDFIEDVYKRQCRGSG